MKISKIITVSFVLLAAIGNSIAQSPDALLGKWSCPFESDGEKGSITYEFKQKDGKILAYTTYLEDDKGNGAADHSLVLKDIDFSDGKGKATSILKEGKDTYQIKADLVLKNPNTLEIRYTAWGYSEKETWRRKQ